MDRMPIAVPVMLFLIVAFLLVHHSYYSQRFTSMEDDMKNLQSMVGNLTAIITGKSTRTNDYPSTPEGHIELRKKRSLHIHHLHTHKVLTFVVEGDRTTAADETGCLPRDSHIVRYRNGTSLRCLKLKSCAIPPKSINEQYDLHSITTNGTIGILKPGVYLISTQVTFGNSEHVHGRMSYQLREKRRGVLSECTQPGFNETIISKKPLVTCSTSHVVKVERNQRADIYVLLLTEDSPHGTLHGGSTFTFINVVRL